MKGNQVKTTKRIIKLALVLMFGSMIICGLKEDVFATNYSVIYHDNFVSGMPVDVSAKTLAPSLTLSSTTPIRDGYVFNGWCTTLTADGENCTGTQYAAGGTFNIDQTSNNNNLTLYAMWKESTTFAKAFTNAGKSQSGGYYVMQDMTSSICSAVDVGEQAQLIDNRDNKVYYVAKEADEKCWMTQNLDLELATGGAYNPTTGTSTALTSNNTHLTTSGSGIYATDYSTSGGVITWTPPSGAVTASHTISGATVSPAFSTSNSTIPESAEGGDTYVYTSGTTSKDTVFSSLSNCQITGGHTEAECKHYHVGNYYSWTAAIASSNSSGISTDYDNAANDICPKGWRLPKGRASSDTSSTREFGYLLQQAGVTSSLTASSYANGGFNKLRTTPLFFVRGGSIYDSSLYGQASYGRYWSSTVSNRSTAYGAHFDSPSSITSATNYSRYLGFSVRCTAQ